MFVYAGIESERYEEALLVIQQQLEDMLHGQLSDDEIEFTKVGLINQYRQSDDPPLTGAALQMYARYTGRAWSVQELIDAIDRVDKSDVVRIAERVHLDTVYFLKSKGGEAK